jgi:hypothetical protein
LLGSVHLFSLLLARHRSYCPKDNGCLSEKVHWTDLGSHLGSGATQWTVGNVFNKKSGLSITKTSKPLLQERRRER